ncbi:MAG: glycosyltransferase family 2 protein [Candidatus Tumulicola sp.]
MTEPAPRIDATYLLPIRREQAGRERELATYLASLPISEIIVVDGSPAAAFNALRDALPAAVKHLPPDPSLRGLNGKVRGVLTGLRHATHERVVIADDDVRYDAKALREIAERLDSAEVIRPQNYFKPAPWHAIFDGARSLINRSLDGDWPGTLAIRKSALPDAYNADVLFENLELVRTIHANGGRECVARDLFVRRLPPTSQHYWSQRVRQAYDEFARPARLAVAVTIIPLLCASVLLETPAIAETIAIAAIALAFAGWLRDGAWKHFSLWSVAAAPLWLAERGLCAWIAVYQRVARGGVRYAGNVIRDAATPPAHLTRRAP